jgi:putative nucleotidyltransferase with HDIG domain
MKILIVDDNQQILDLLKGFFEDEDFEVNLASSGKNAKEQIPLYEPDLIISDIKMEPMNGIELLHFVKREASEIPVVLMTGFADLLMVEEALELGAFSLIKKPFEFEKLLETVQSALDIPLAKKPEFVDKQFLKIDLNRFVSGNTVPCCLFIRIKENHFVKIAHKGESIPPNTLDRFKEKKLEFLHVLKEEYGEFIGFNFRILEGIDTAKNISNEKAISFINYSNSLILEKTFLLELNKQTIKEVEKFSNLAFSILTERKSLMNMLKSLSDHCEYTYAHSLSTAIMSYLLAKKVSWNNEATLMKVFMAGLLHDVGLKFIPKDILDKNPMMWTEDERKEYESHTTRGMEALNSIGDIPEEVILSAYQHHEDCTGHGFPLSLMKSKISPVSKLVSCADIIEDKIVGKHDLSLNGYREAVKQVEKFKRNHYDAFFLDALKEVLKM